MPNGKENTVNFAENKHTYVSGLVLKARAGATLCNAVLEAIETACKTDCNVELIHNGYKYSIDLDTIYNQVESTKQKFD